MKRFLVLRSTMHLSFPSRTKKFPGRWPQKNVCAVRDCRQCSTVGTCSNNFIFVPCGASRLEELFPGVWKVYIDCVQRYRGAKTEVNSSNPTVLNVHLVRHSGEVIAVITCVPCGRTLVPRPGKYPSLHRTGLLACCETVRIQIALN